MPTTFKVLGQGRLGYVSMSGSVAGQDIIDATFYSLTDAAWIDLPIVLWDCRRITALDLDLPSAHRVAGLITMHAEYLGPSRHGIVVAREQDWIVGRLVLRLIHLKNREIRIFRSLAETCDWLGVSPGEFGLPV